MPREQGITSILHINTNDLKGGAAKVAWRLVEAQRKKGIDSRLLVGYKEGDHDISYSFPIEHNSIIYESSRNNGLLYYDLEGSHKLQDNVLVQCSDLVHLHNLHGDYFNPYSLQVLSKAKPIVWTLHDMQALTGHCANSLDCDRWITGCNGCPDLTLYPPIKIDSASKLWNDKKGIYQNSEMIIVTPSLWMKKKAEEGLLKNHRIELIYNGVDTNIFSPKDKVLVRRKHNLPQDKIIIGFVANGGAWGNKLKGSYYIEKAMKNLQRSEHSFIFLNIGSGNGQSKVDSNIINSGYISDEHEMAELYSALDVFLFPSLAESYSLVISEAMSCGVPIVTFDTGGIPERIRHGETGFVASYGEEHELLKYLFDLIADEDVRKKLSIAARLDIVKNYDHQLIASQYERIYADCISEKGVTDRHYNSYTWNKNPQILILDETETTASILDKCENESFDFIYFSHKDIQKGENFLELITYNYKDEDLISCNLMPKRTDGSLFYRNIFPSDFFTKLYDWRKKGCILFSRKFFNDNKTNILENGIIKANNVTHFYSGYVSIFLDNYFKLLLGDERDNINLFFYGAGTHTKDLLKNINKQDYNIRGVIDKNKALEGQEIEGYPIYHISQLDDLMIDKIIISTATFEQEVYNELIERLPIKKIEKMYNYY